MDKYLNIVSFNIPYPANYGGVIDVYYKLEALRACGVKLILHCLTWLPYNVYSRKDHRLIENLLQK